MRQTVRGCGISAAIAVSQVIYITNRVWGKKGAKREGNNGRGGLECAANDDTINNSNNALRDTAYMFLL